MLAVLAPHFIATFLLVRRKDAVRIEDTDQERSSVEYMRMQLADLKWLGYEFQEGVDVDSLKDAWSMWPV